MTRTNFKTIIKFMSDWKIDKRKGNYMLPSGTKLSRYLEELTFKFCQKNDLVLGKNGNVYTRYVDNKNVWVFVPFGTDYIMNYEEEMTEIEKLIKEMVGN